MPETIAAWRETNADGYVYGEKAGNYTGRLVIVGAVGMYGYDDTEILI